MAPEIIQNAAPMLRTLQETMYAIDPRILNVLKKEAYLQGYADVFFALLVLVVFTAAQLSIPRILKLSNKPAKITDKSGKTYDVLTKREGAWVLYWITTTISAILFYFLSKAALSALLNPEFWSLQRLIEMLEK